MSARAIWKGTLKIKSERVPVKLYSAVEDRSVHFHLLDRDDDTRVKQHMINPNTGREVPREEIVRGLEIEPGTFVKLSEKELESVQPEPSRDITILRFVPPDKIDHQWYSRPYYLGPDEDEVKYFALADALERQDREGVARWVMRNKQYIGALRAQDGYLLLVSLRYAGEVVSARDIPAPTGRAFDHREIKMAEQLVMALEGDFRPSDFHDEYRERVMDLIQAKAHGTKPKLQPIRSKAATSGLLETLAASLKSARKKGGRAVA